MVALPCDGAAMPSGARLALLLCVTLAIVALTRSEHSAYCKELNQVNCYTGYNEGYFCNSKDQTKTQTRWFYDKGACRKFSYKGCYGNRNRFCTKESCERRCRG